MSNPPTQPAAEVRAAFRAGWLVNAIPPHEHPAGSDYAWSCEDADWQEWKRRQVSDT